MQNIVGVRFRSVGKIYYFDPTGLTLQKGQYIIVETARGIECGEVVTPNRDIPDEEWAAPLKPVLRIATPEDLERLRQNEEFESHAYAVCAEKIRAHGLEMKLIDVECTFDNSKILFYFSAEGRIDFRELVKDLASVLKTRIELRQIGVRDEAKMLGGLGICGRPFCCATFLGEFQPVSIRMAKEQDLSLNPTKISGTCGRLMCCLKYEQNVYEELIRITPKQGALVQTPEGRGTVTEVSLLTGFLKVLLDKNETVTPFHRDEVKLISRNKPPREKTESQGKDSGKEDNPQTKHSPSKRQKKSGNPQGQSEEC